MVFHFVFQNSEFQMYQAYCRNRTASEALVNECTESETFFKGIQMRLAHQLSLSAYLLKPVQRVTKYQLLLKVGVLVSASDQSFIRGWDRIS